MGIIIGRNTRVEVGKTLSAAIAVSAISLADPPVLSYEGAVDPPNGSILLISDDIEGTFELAGVAVRSANAAIGGSPATLELEGLDSTNYGALTAESSMQYVTAWSTIGLAKTFAQAEGSVNKKDRTVLLDNKQRFVLAQPELPDIKVDGLSDPFQEALGIIREGALSGDILVFRVTAQDGSKRIVAGYVSLPGENISTQEIATSGFTIVPTGSVIPYAS